MWDRTPASVPQPAEGRSSPKNTPVFPPSSFMLWSFAFSIFSFPLIRYSCPLSAGILRALLCLKVYSWCIHGERCAPRPPTPPQSFSYPILWFLVNRCEESLRRSTGRKSIYPDETLSAVPGAVFDWLTPPDALTLLSETLLFLSLPWDKDWTVFSLCSVIAEIKWRVANCWVGHKQSHLTCNFRLAETANYSTW